ncbi:Bug family tripartite tricarboxylate transporter substrate binding protein [Rubrivivax sp. RP6-9]|uniref:Bug family tripartite tricarboxylate transporter substrate binding protein n=1 Tax=Rubrivivax sp. RP6-9 TaxID=3415750 RepID=UPI003CC6D605
MPDRRQVLASVAATLAMPAVAQSDKSVSLVVGYAPGGSTDLTARIIGPELGRRLGRTVVIENVAGAGGTLGAQKVAAARPDGQTLLLGTNNEMSIHKLINRAARVDGIADFTPLGLIGSQPMMLVASTRVGVKTLDEFLAQVKRAPGKYSYGSSGIGTALHLAGELVKQRSGLFMVHIPYRGVAPLTNDLIGGVLEFGVFVLSSGLPHVRSGKVMALGSTQLAPSPIAPDIPPLGAHPQLQGLDMASWFGLFGPAQLPASQLQRLQEALRDTLAAPDVRKKLEEAGATLADPRADLASFMKSERDKYAAIVKFANIQE